MTDLYHAYDLRDRALIDILNAYTMQHGTPPQPLEVVVNKVDSESIFLESIEMSKRVERWVLPHVVFFGIEEKIDESTYCK
jgi:hypothetical protein